MLDLVVVGGGIIGGTAAHEARIRHPDWTIAVCDPAPGSGATRWSLGVSFPLAPTSQHRPLVRDSLRWHLRWASTPALRRALRMLFVVDKANTRSFQSQVVGPPLSPAHPDLVEEARRTWSLRLTDDDEVLAGDDRVFQVDAQGLLRELLTAAKPTMVRRCVESITVGRDISTLALDDGTSLVARRVVVATGPWYPTGIGKYLGVPRDVVVKRVSALECSGHPTTPVAVYFVDDDLMIIPDASGERTLVSFCRRAWHDHPDASTGELSSDDLAEGRSVLSRRSPSLAAAIVGGRSFCDAYCPGRLPVREIAGRHVVALVGGSGSGVRLAPALAGLAINQLEHNEPAELL